MRRLCLAIALTSALSALTAQAALQLDSWTRVAGTFGGTGGEFLLDPNAELATKLVMGTPSDLVAGTFQSFCLEQGEPINTPADVVINNKAIWGGVGPGGDVLSKGTAWLYSQFRGGVLSGYDYTVGAGRAADAVSLQEAIWYLEGGSAVANDFVTAVTTKFGSFAAAQADMVGYEYGVVVLNLWKPGKIDSTDPADRYQDQLAIVPEPSTVIAAALLLLPFGASTIRILRKNRVP